MLPTWASLHQLRALASQALQDTSRFAPPAPAYPAIVLMTVAGIGVVAVATDLIAVRLRRPALAGLPLLVLFCVPLTVSVHQGAAGEMAVFCLGMAGYLTLLAWTAGNGCGCGAAWSRSGSTATMGGTGPGRTPRTWPRPGGGSRWPPW